ncbi:MAG TPA: hypothetical protein VGM80_06115 [Gaiellaceae bacterium]|jgi:hypothetical protein
MRLQSRLAIGVATLLATWLVAAAAAAGAPRHANAGPLVATVATASGGHLTVKRKAGGATETLHVHSNIYYGDIVQAGPGATATFEVTTPKGVSSDNELLFIQPVDGAHHTITMKGSGGTVVVTLGR